MVCKNVRETSMERGVKKVHDYLKANDLLAVPFDKVCGFCVMKKSTYMEKLDEVLNSDQFQIINGAKDDIVIKNEKQINNSLQQLMKQGKLVTKFIKDSGQLVYNQQGFMVWQRYIKKYTSPTCYFDTWYKLRKLKQICDTIFPESTGRKHGNERARC